MQKAVGFTLPPVDRDGQSLTFILGLDRDREVLLAEWLIDHQPDTAKELIRRGPAHARAALIRAMDRRIGQGGDHV